MIKKLLSLVAICAIISLANCSRIEHNTDPIIGIWAQSKTVTSATSSKKTVRKEWIFNDVYLGRYHEIEGNNTTLVTDFKWSKQDDVYTIEYRGLEDKPNHIITIEATDNVKHLESMDGNTVATRE